MSHLPGYAGHVMGLQDDCGRRSSALAYLNALKRPPTPTPKMCVRLDDLLALKSYEADVTSHKQGLSLPILRSRVEHHPTATTLLLMTVQTRRNLLNSYAGPQERWLS